jgi:transcriptional regulator GlxA family with amidase domain
MMDRRTFMKTGTAGVVIAGVTGCAGGKAMAYAPEDIPAAERAATVAAMKPPKRTRPVVAVLGENDGCETTDFIVPWSVLTRSGVADVLAVSVREGPVKMVPALTIRAQATIAAFDAMHPDGADYVIVPAFHDPKAKAAAAWIKAQAEKGATVIGVCAGALPLAHAGLLDGRAATTHWFSTGDIQRIAPTMTWKKNRRFVADRGVVTTTGVSASLPMALTMVEAIAGRAKAEALAAELGVADFSERHDSSAFTLDMSMALRASMNTVAVLGHEKLALPIADGVDEMALAFTADAWSRTFRSQCATVGTGETVRTARGLEIVADHAGEAPGGTKLLPELSGLPGESLEAALAAIDARYGRSTAAFVALQLEYPWVA